MAATKANGLAAAAKRQREDVLIMTEIPLRPALAPGATM
jgi:hypothetical protein